jgi:hypothetical protein
MSTKSGLLRSTVRNQSQDAQKMGAPLRSFGEIA